MGKDVSKARHAKSKARLGAYENLLNQDVKQKEDKLEIFIPNGPRLGDKVIEATAVSKSFDEKLLFEDLEFSFLQMELLVLSALMVPEKQLFSE